MSDLFALIKIILALILFFAAALPYMNQRKRELEIFTERMKQFTESNKYIYKKSERNNKVLNGSFLFSNNYRYPIIGAMSSAMNYTEGKRQNFKIILFNCDSPGSKGKRCYLTGVLLEYDNNLSKIVINKNDYEMAYMDFDLAWLAEKPYVGIFKKRFTKITIGNRIDIYALKTDYEQNKSSVDKIISIKDYLLSLPLKSYQIETLKGGMLLYFSEPPKDIEHLSQVVDKFIEFAKSMKM